ncbi:MAG: GNAT family N-acetyltransferase [Candidatus Xenobiia bacterium LiM19]
MRWTDVSSRYLIIHRLAVSPEWQSKGAGQRLMDFAENFALERNYACYQDSPLITLPEVSYA